MSVSYPGIPRGAERAGRWTAGTPLAPPARRRKLVRPILIVPGYGDSGPGHWQTLFETKLPGAERVRMPSFDAPDPT
ncbi:MAG TPA: alpha/beta hydrolase, partial [Myxococcota bacterium]|nr:alpha/beta hydrolase [Myxococcota bacterium]